MGNKILPFSVCWVSTEPSVSAQITYLRPPRIPGGRYQYPHFLEEKTGLRQVKLVPDRAGVCTQLLWISKGAVLAYSVLPGLRSAPEG